MLFKSKNILQTITRASYKNDITSGFCCSGSAHKFLKTGLNSSVDYNKMLEHTIAHALNINDIKAYSSLIKKWKSKNNTYSDNQILDAQQSVRLGSILEKYSNSEDQPHNAITQYCRSNQSYCEYMISADKEEKSDKLLTSWVKNTIKKVQCLLEIKRESKRANGDMNAVLKTAIYRNNLTMVKYSIEHGADINTVDDDGFNPLHWSMFSNLEIVKYLVELGADVNQADNSGYTPLYFAIDKGNLEIVKYLVEHGADVNQASYYGCTPLERAIAKNKLEIAKYLVEQDADVNCNLIVIE